MTTLIKLTKTFVDNVEIPLPNGNARVQKIYRDTKLNGFGLRVTSSGSKSFVVEQKLNGRTKRVTIAKYGHLTTEQARKEAQRILGDMAVGKDPNAERKVALAMKVTLSEAFEDYLKTRKNLKPSTINDYQRVMREVFSTWQNKRLTDIDKDMVQKKHDDYGKRSQARANNAMRVLRAVFNHAIKKYEDADGNPILKYNPVSRLSNNRAWFNVGRKQRVIKNYELPIWWEQVEQFPRVQTSNYFKFLLLTGLRRDEAAKLKWEYIDFKLNTISLPGNEQGIEQCLTKNGLLHVLPMSDYLHDLFWDMSESSDSESEYVFPSRTSLSKTPYFNSPESACRKLSKASGVEFSCHDLRRTFITVAESIDLSTYALKRLMNHSMKGDITAGYIISDVDRLRDPMQRITDKFMELIY